MDQQNIIQENLNKLTQILEGSEFEGCLNPPATKNQLSHLERSTGIKVEGGLRNLWLLANGAEYRKYGTPVFGVYTDEATPCDFLSITESIEIWAEIQSGRLGSIRNILEVYEAQREGIPNAQWLPFARFNGFATIVFYTFRPGHAGNSGQIIAYQHDPDQVHFIAISFAEFFKRSNQLLSTEVCLINWINN